MLWLRLLFSQGHKQEFRGENCPYVGARCRSCICPVSFQGLWPPPSICCRGTKRSRPWIPHRQISQSWGGRGSPGVFSKFTSHAVIRSMHGVIGWRCNVYMFCRHCHLHWQRKRGLQLCWRMTLTPIDWPSLRSRKGNNTMLTSSCNMLTVFVMFSTFLCLLYSCHKCKNHHQVWNTFTYLIELMRHEACLWKRTSPKEEIGARAVVGVSKFHNLSLSLCVSGQWRVFSGNELGALLGWWMFRCWKQQNSDAAAVKSLYMLSSTVSSKILRAIALKEGFHFEVTNSTSRP